MNDSFNYLGASMWWAHQNISLITTTTMKTVPAAGGTSVGTTHPGTAGSSMQYRLVITGYHIAGNNTNAAACTIEVRASGGSVAISDVCPLTTGNIRSDNTNCWLPLPANESVEVRTTGALTGNIRVTLYGRIFPATTPLADFYDGAAH